MRFEGHLTYDLRIEGRRSYSINRVTRVNWSKTDSK